jgi:hypothetical protein
MAVEECKLRRTTAILAGKPYCTITLVKEAQVGAIRDELFFDLFTAIEVPISKPEIQHQIVRTIDTQLVAFAGARHLQVQAETTMRHIVRGLFRLSANEG